jgi:hypothetical protein
LGEVNLNARSPGFESIRRLQAKRETNQNPIKIDGVLMVHLPKKRFKPMLKLIGLVSALLSLG